ncbi:MAG: hypothetical protein MUF37_05720 [Methanoregulaceae archaeon]|nr:hypothetical protein [Methanoregulaceae archaeon]
MQFELQARIVYNTPRLLETQAVLAPDNRTGFNRIIPVDEKQLETIIFYTLV